MNPAYTAYHLITRLLYGGLLPGFRAYSRLSGRRDETINQRLGIYHRNVLPRLSGSPRVWLHAASVGEVGVAESIIASLDRLKPGCGVIVSTATQHGHAHAVKRLGPRVTCIYAPADFPQAVDKALRTLEPDLLACLETEIWPNLLITAKKTGIRTAIINGRISVRSIRGYLKIRPLIKEALDHVDRFSMIGGADAVRIQRLGASKDRIEVNGNAKYDLLLAQATIPLKEKIESQLNLKGDQPVFLAGSTRGAEANIILDVYEKIRRTIPEALLIIAPRHISKTPDIEKSVREKGFEYQLKTHLEKPGINRTAPVLIINTIGELQALYSIASLVFCGGSLEPLGGQNVLEAAVWGKPVLYGSSMADFLDAKALLEKTGGGIQVKDGADLAEKAIYYLSHPSEAEALGRLAKEAVLSNTGAADKHAAVIWQLLQQ